MICQAEQNCFCVHTTLKTHDRSVLLDTYFGASQARQGLVTRWDGRAPLTFDPSLLTQGQNGAPVVWANAAQHTQKINPSLNLVSSSNTYLFVVRHLLI